MLRSPDELSRKIWLARVMTTPLVVINDYDRLSVFRLQSSVVRSLFGFLLRCFVGSQLRCFIRSATAGRNNGNYATRGPDKQR
jgi:hypothetical protein